MQVENQIPDDLDAFNALLSGDPVEPEAHVEEQDGEIEDGEDTPATEVEASEAEDPELEEEVPVDEPDDSLLKIGKKKQTARERIEELNAKFREEERLRIEIQNRLAELEAKPQKETKEDVTQPRTGPNPDDVDSEGEPLYPLGEFDPNFVRALADFSFDQRIASYEAEQARKDEAVREARVRNEIQSEWNTRLDAAEASLPDLREKGKNLEIVFEGVDSEFGDYVATTLMTLNNGPEVLYYLSDNLTEARDIIKSGPVGVAIALGRLDALMQKAEAKPVKKVTEAPSPIPNRSRGTGGKYAVAPDTDDLAAFEEMFLRR